MPKALSVARFSNSARRPRSFLWQMHDAGGSDNPHSLQSKLQVTNYSVQ